MANLYDTAQSAGVRSLETNKVLRNTYALLAVTLLFSALTAGISMAIGIPFGAALVMNIVALGLLWFVLPRTAHSSSGVFVVFAFTGLLGAGLGPMLNAYVSYHGGGIVFQALAGTAIVFFTLSGYVLTTRKDFSFMGGFLMVGLVTVLLFAIGAMVAGFFGVDVSMVSLAISGAIVLLMSGFILYDTSRIIHGGETNYLFATASLYLNILNLFTSLLHLLGAFSGDD